MLAAAGCDGHWWWLWQCMPLAPPGESGTTGLLSLAYSPLHTTQLDLYITLNSHIFASTIFNNAKHFVKKIFGQCE